MGKKYWIVLFSFLALGVVFITLWQLGYFDKVPETIEPAVEENTPEIHIETNMETQETNLEQSIVEPIPQKTCESLFSKVDLKLKDIETLCTRITQEQFNILFQQVDDSKLTQIKHLGSILNKFPETRLMLKHQVKQLAYQDQFIDFETHTDWNNVYFPNECKSKQIIFQKMNEKIREYYESNLKCLDRYVDSVKYINALIETPNVYSLSKLVHDVSSDSIQHSKNIWYVNNNFDPKKLQKSETLTVVNIEILLKNFQQIRPNSYALLNEYKILEHPKVCSALKKMLQQQNLKVVSDLQFNDSTCYFPTGVYKFQLN